MRPIEHHLSTMLLSYSTESMNQEAKL